MLAAVSLFTIELAGRVVFVTVDQTYQSFIRSDYDELLGGASHDIDRQNPANNKTT